MVATVRLPVPSVALMYAKSMPFAFTVAQLMLGW